MIAIVSLIVLFISLRIFNSDRPGPSEKEVVSALQEMSPFAISIRGTGGIATMRYDDTIKAYVPLRCKTDTIHILKIEAHDTLTWQVLAKVSIQQFGVDSHGAELFVPATMTTLTSFSLRKDTVGVWRADFTFPFMIL